VLTLSACAQESITQWAPIESPKKNQVSWAEYHHPVKFAKSSTKLNRNEKTALNRFLNRVGIGEGVQVTLSRPSSNSSPQAKHRETGLARYLINNGFDVSRVALNPAYSTRRNTIRVTVGRYIVTTPNCPDWSKPAASDSFNRVSSNFNCATETNLGLMVANPEALIRGTRTGPADGEAVALGIKNYRENKVEIPEATSARDSLGGGGTGK